MSRLFTQDYLCACGWTDVVLTTTTGGQSGTPETHTCPECGEQAPRKFGGPTVLAVAIPDGVSRGDGWKRAKEAAHLKKARRNLHYTKRGEIDKEIKKLDRANVQKNAQDKFRVT